MRQANSHLSTVANTLLHPFHPATEKYDQTYPNSNHKYANQPLYKLNTFILLKV